MLSLIQDYLFHHWQDIEPGRTMPKKLNFLLSGEKAFKNKTALIFEPGNPQPVLIAKIARTPDGAQFLQKEFQALTAVKASLDAGNRKYRIPRPVACRHFGPDLVLLETMLAGESLASLWGKLKPGPWLRAFQTTLPEVAQLLMELQAQLSPPNRKIELSAFASTVWEHFCAAFSPTDAEKRKFAQIVDSALIREQKTLPATWNHGDFWIGNILQTADGTLGLLDWEFVQEDGLPFWDLFFFMTTATLFSPEAQWGKQMAAGLRVHFAAQSPALAACRRAIQQMNRSLGIPEACLPALFDLFLFDMATFYFRQYGRTKKLDNIIREFIQNGGALE